MRTILAVITACILFFPTAKADDESLGKARAALRARDYDAAVKHFKRAAKDAGGDCADCYWGLAQAYNGLGATKNVIESCDRLLASNPDGSLRARALNLKGVALSSKAGSKLDKLQEAERELRAALTADEDLAEVHYNLGTVLFRQNRDEEGKAALKAFLDSDPDEELAEDAQAMIDNPRRAREPFFPNFAAVTKDGEHMTMEDLSGKVVIFDFWATWCPPCVESVPDLRRLHKRFAEDPRVVLISVSVDDDEQKWSNFLAQNQMAWTQIRDEHNRFTRKFMTRDGLAIPTYMVVDGEGLIRYRSTGAQQFTVAFLVDEVKKVLKKMPEAQQAGKK